MPPVATVERIVTVCRWAGHETPTLFLLAVFGSFISYIYSAPPLKLKQSGWAGNYALGASYIALPWLAGQVCPAHFALLLRTWWTACHEPGCNIAS